MTQNQTCVHSLHPFPSSSFLNETKHFHPKKGEGKEEGKLLFEGKVLHIDRRLNFNDTQTLCPYPFFEAGSYFV